MCSPCKVLIGATGAGKCWKTFSESTQCCLSFVSVKSVSGQGRTDVKIPPKKGLLFVDPADPPQPHLACRAPAALFFSSKRMLTLEKRAPDCYQRHWLQMHSSPCVFSSFSHGNAALQLVLPHLPGLVNTAEPQHGPEHLSWSSLLFNCQHMPWHGAGSLPASPPQTMPGHSFVWRGSLRDKDEDSGVSVCVDMEGRSWPLWVTSSWMEQVQALGEVELQIIKPVLAADLGCTALINFSKRGGFKSLTPPPSAFRGSITYPALGFLFAQIFVPSLFPTPVTEVQIILDLWLTSVHSTVFLLDSWEKQSGVGFGFWCQMWSTTLFWRPFILPWTSPPRVPAVSVLWVCLDA